MWLPHPSGTGATRRTATTQFAAIRRGEVDEPYPLGAKEKLVVNQPLAALVFPMVYRHRYTVQLRL
jgi:hypothetical protein